jgi:hypothetical protein
VIHTLLNQLLRTHGSRKALKRVGVPKENGSKGTGEKRKAMRFGLTASGLEITVLGHMLLRHLKTTLHILLTLLVFSKQKHLKSL